jgi:hypothetical protein
MSGSGQDVNLKRGFFLSEERETKEMYEIKMKKDNRFFPSPLQSINIQRQ